MKVSPSAWKNWPVMGVGLGVVALSAIGVAYWSNVQDRERYLQSRNFRLLAVLADQTDEFLENRGKVYRVAIGSTLSPEVERSQWTYWIEWPGTSEFRSTERTNPAIHELTGGEVFVAESLTSAGGRVRRAPRPESHVTSEGAALRFDWRTAPNEPADLSVKVQAAEALSGVFEPKLEQGAFDTVLLANAKDGRVIYATGRRATELYATTVSSLLPVAPGAAAGQVAEVGRTISEERVRIAGVDYRMFTQPCCGGFVVIGLVEAQAMLQASLAISPVLVLVGAVLLMAALVGWSFFKVALVGPQQRITRLDVLQLGASGIFGLAMATALALTASTYARLSGDVDQQLEQLADRLHGRLSTEITSAALQLTAMTKALEADPCVTATPATGAPAQAAPEDPCASITSRWSVGEDLPGRHYKDFTAFALLDTSGFQRIKAAFSSATRRRIEASDRGYFHQARSREGLWKLPECPEGCVLESHWSWTTGKPQVVLSTPTSLDQLPVAALSIPMRALLEPVLPPGFEFAIIDATGQVQFHSDTQRNVHENLLLETDQNRRLRSLVTAHGAGTLDTSYWGSPFRAYVRPTLVPGWSVVALHTKQPTRALVVEWSVVALMMQTGFMLLWILSTLALMATGTSFLWPDPLRRPWYRALAILYAAAFVLWLAVAWRADRTTTMWIGVLWPTVLWGITWAILRRRPGDVGQVKAWSDLCDDYRLAGTLILIITATVPAASFYALSSSLHLEAYLKERQIALAHAAEQSTSCSQGRAPSHMGVEEVRYDDVFYGSRIDCAPAQAPVEMDPRARRLAHLRLEDYIPYLTSASVSLRELMHRRADDDAWVSRPLEPNGRVPNGLEVNVRAEDPSFRLAVSSPQLPVLGIHTIGDPPRLVWVALLSLMLLVVVAGAAYWMVGYLLRRVVLADVVEPVRASGAVPRSPGPHALVLCDDPAAMAKELQDLPTLLLTPIVNAPNVANAWRAARRWLSDITSAQRVVIPDLDVQSDEVAVIRRKMELIEELVSEPEPSLLVLTHMSKRALTSCVRESWRWTDKTERWAQVISRFIVVDRRQGRAGGSNADAGAKIRSWWWQLRAVIRDRKDAFVRQRRSSGGTPSAGTGAAGPGSLEPARPADDWRTALVNSEAAAHPPITPYCDELKQTPAFTSGILTRDQILEEIEERAGSIYRSVWLSCDDDERVILEHVARHGLASAASRRVVRRLLARGLLRKDPDLRLMNRSFRRYVLETERRVEVASLERQAGPSLWDQLRLPLGTAAILVAAFLAATQREAFNATITMAAGVTTAVPTLAKLMASLMQMGEKSTAEPKANANANG